MQGLPLGDIFGPNKFQYLESGGVDFKRQMGRLTAKITLTAVG